MMASRPCQSAHCSGANAEINEICKQLGWPVSHPVETRDALGPCVCSCSCLAYGTPVEAADGSQRAIESYVVGDAIKAAGLSLQWRSAEVVFSGGTTGASRQKYTVLVAYGDTSIAVTSDHLFLMPDGKLKAADRLTLDESLVDPSGKPVPVTGVFIGDYFSGFHHVATSKQLPGPDLNDHLLNTNGVVSADYTLQLFYRGGELESHLAESHDALPVVGSPEYVERHGEAVLNGPAENALGRSIARNGARDILPGTFVPASATRIKVPADAVPFISDEEARQKAKDPKRRWNDPMSKEWTEALLHHHRYFYPNVAFSLDWASNEVNAYAWTANGVRHVAIMGGLVRDMRLELEGIAVVLAHEIGHHYGGPPTYPHGASCEGQADYYGVGFVMRKVWFGDDYQLKTDRGIGQMAAFFGVPNSPNDPGGVGNCSHPPGLAGFPPITAP